MILPMLVTHYARPGFLEVAGAKGVIVAQRLAGTNNVQRMR